MTPTLKTLEELRKEFNERFDGDYNFNSYYRKPVEDFWLSQIESERAAVREFIETKNCYNLVDIETGKKNGVYKDSILALIPKKS